MPIKQHVTPGEKLPLNLTTAERKLILDELIVTGMEYEQLLRSAPTGQPVMMTLSDLDDFGGYIAAESNHCENKKKQQKLDAIFKKVQGLLDKFTDEELPQTVKIEDARKAKVVSDQSAQIAEWAAKVLATAEQLGINKKPLEHFWLAPAQRDVLLLVPDVTPAVKKKLAKDGAQFTVSEVAGMTMALAEDLTQGDARKQVAVLVVANHLMDRLQDGIVGSAKPLARKKSKSKAKVASDTLFQFKITLQDSTPPIWRRIQIMDCTLDKLHEHIQTAMGWTNSHLHQFEADGQRYADPRLLEETFEEMDCLDSTTTMLSDLLPKNGKRFRFVYEYDFGDSWYHEVLFEGCPKREPGQKYPLCLEGVRACPPEDVGGVWGYVQFLEALANPQHELHEQFMEWTGPFDAGEFDAGKATKAMKKGLPNWKV